MANLAYFQETAPRYRFGPHDKIVIGDTVYRWANADDHGHLLRRHDDQALAEWFSHEDIYGFMRNDTMVIDHDCFLASKAALRGRVGTMRLGDLPPEEQATILWRQEYCDRFLAMERQERAVTRSDAAMRMAIFRIKAELDALELARLGRAPRCGTQALGQQPPSPSSLRAWLRNYEAAGYDALALRDAYRKSGNRTPRVDMESKQFMLAVATRYASSNKPTMAMLYREYGDELATANVNRRQIGHRPLTQVSQRTFEKAIAGLDPFFICSGREGADAARRKFGIVRGGLDVTRPLERIEMDEWKVSLQVLLTEAGMWPFLSREQREAVERTRAWLSAALDTASRSVLALRLLAEAPSASSAIACLEMAVCDKTDSVSAIGARTLWDQHGRFEVVAMDSGSAFIATETKAVIKDLGAEAIYPPSGMAEMRARIERLFGTFQQDFIRHFAGQTFENIFRKGDYDSEANACLDLEALNSTLIRYVVDVYHNTPHEGLAGETPRNAWLRLTAKFPVLPPPGKAERRHIFGLTEVRRIQNRGVRFLGIHYQSEALQRLRRTVGQKPVRIRVNCFDLSEVSVWNGEGWMSVGPAIDGLDLSGVSVWEWIAAAQDLRRRHADMAKMTADTVKAALSAIRDTADIATQRAELGSPVLADADFEKLERDLFRTFGFRSTTGSPDAQDDDILAEEDEFPSADNQISGQDFAAPSASDTERDVLSDDSGWFTEE